MAKSYIQCSYKFFSTLAKGIKLVKIEYTLSLFPLRSLGVYVLCKAHKKWIYSSKENDFFSCRADGSLPCRQSRDDSRWKIFWNRCISSIYFTLQTINRAIWTCLQVEVRSKAGGRAKGRNFKQKPLFWRNSVEILAKGGTVFVSRAF